MATYLQGVQDYIPQFQPFQPDLNLYAKVLETKQTQYDTAWKSLNNVYGQYFYADLTRDNNIARKEEILKNIDFNVKKIASLDLSLDENVGKALKVFKPFYEDQYLMKDMAWTKNYNNQKGRAEGFKNSQDEKMREQYWDGGVRALDYLREEFKEAADQESLGFQNASYTPYVNAVKKAQQIAKDAGLSVETVEFSKDGQWIVKNKNGKALYEPLSKLFEASLGSDPAIQAVYKTQAYLDRKDYAYSNAAQFNGDRNAAEMKYLEDSYNVLKQDNEKRYKNLKNASESYESKIKNIETQIRNKTAPPDAEETLERLKEAKDINDKIIQRIDTDNESMKEQSGTPSTSTGFQNPFGDIKSLRWKVDNGMASKLMQKDLDEAAQIFMYKDSKVDIEANPYAVNEQKHQFQMKEIAARNAGIERAARIRNQGDMEKAAAEALYESGTHEPDLNQYVTDPETGQKVANPNYMKPKLKEEFAQTYTEKTTSGSVTDTQNKIEIARRKVRETTNEKAVPYLSALTSSLDSLYKSKAISDDDLKYIFAKYPGMSINKMKGIIQSGGLSNFLMFSNDPWKAKDLANRVENRLAQYSADSRVASTLKTLTPMKNSFKDYATYLENQRTFFRDGAKEVETELTNQGFKYAKFLYDNNGRLRSEKEFEQLIPEEDRVKSVKDMGVFEYIASQRGRGLPAKEVESTYSVDTKVKDPLGYKEMLGAASKVWTSGRVKAPLVGIPGAGSGLAQTERNSVNVSTTGPEWLPGRQAMSGFIKDFRKIDFDGMKSKVTVAGASKDAFDSTDMSRSKRYQAVIDAFINDVNSGKTKVKDFKLSSQTIAAGSALKGAMIIVPPTEWLEKYKGKVDKDSGALTNLLSETEFNNVIKNGFSVISDGNNFTNDLYKSANMSPLQANIEYKTQRDKNYEYIEKSPYDPDGDTYFSIRKDQFGTGDYKAYFQWKEWNPDKGTYEIKSTDAMGTFGSNLEALRDSYQEDFDRIRLYNIRNKNL